MNPYFAIGIQSILALFVAFIVAVLSAATYKRSLMHEENVYRDNALRAEVSTLRAENTALTADLASLRAQLEDMARKMDEFRREAALCKAARRSLLEALVELDKQVRDLKQVPKIDVGVLMSGMNESEL